MSSETKGEFRTATPYSGKSPTAAWEAFTDKWLEKHAPSCRTRFIGSNGLDCTCRSIGLMAEEKAPALAAYAAQNVLRTLPSSPGDRKERPLATGCLDYFPLALAEVARCSAIANEQHNPGQPLHWSRTKSTDHADCLLRHFVQRGIVDSDGILHSSKVAWRALALLQTELEAAAGWRPEEER